MFAVEHRASRSARAWFAFAAVSIALVLPSVVSAQPWSSAGRADHATGSGLEWVSLFDLNNDGRKDLVTANYLSNNISVLLNNGVGGFTRTDYPAGAGPFTVVVTDLNHDIQADLLVANNAAGTISVLLGDGSGSFLSNVDFTSGVNTAVAATGYFDGDGNVDVLTVNWGSNTLSLFLGDGAGGFAPRVDFPTGVNPNWVEVRDVNDDGLHDAIVANFGDSDFSVYLGTGAGTFAPRTDFACGANPLTLEVDDFNGDNLDDVATANYSANTVSVLLGDGSGGFASRVDYPVAADPVTVASGDANVDGKVDLAVTSESADVISLLHGNGNGTFAPKADHAVGGSPYGVVIGDVSGDGRPDIISANFSTNNVSVLTGSLPGGFRTNAIAHNLVGKDQLGVPRALNTDYAGKWRLVDMSAVWCPPCNAIARETERVWLTWQDHPTVDFEYITVLVDGPTAGKASTQANAANWANRYDITRPVIHADGLDRAAIRAYMEALGTNAYPTLFYVDPTGLIRDVVVGGETAQQIVDRLALLAGVPSPPLEGAKEPPPPPPAVAVRSIFQALSQVTVEVGYGETFASFVLEPSSEAGLATSLHSYFGSGIPGIPGPGFLQIQSAVDTTTATEDILVAVSSFPSPLPVGESWSIRLTNMVWPDGQPRALTPSLNPVVSAVELVDESSQNWFQTPIAPAITGLPTEMAFSPFALGNVPNLPPTTNTLAVTGVLVQHVGTVSTMPPPGARVLSLAPPMPNPATGSTRFRWSMPATGNARMRIVDTAGRLVRTLHAGLTEAGAQVTPWDLRGDDGARVAPGIYFGVVEAAGVSRSARVVVLK